MTGFAIFCSVCSVMQGRVWTSLAFAIIAVVSAQP